MSESRCSTFSFGCQDFEPSSHCTKYFFLHTCKMSRTLNSRSLFCLLRFCDPLFCGSEFLHPQSHPVLQGQRWSLLGPCSLSAGGEDGEGPQMLEQSADWQCKSLCIIGRIEPSEYKMCIAFKPASLLQYYREINPTFISCH